MITASGAFSANNVGELQPYSFLITTIVVDHLMQTAYQQHLIVVPHQAVQFQ